MSLRAPLVAFALALGACQKAAPDPCADAKGGAPVGPALLAFLSRSRAAHHRADAFEERSDVQAARAELEAVIHGPLPACPAAAEVREVLADTQARLGDLASRNGDFAAALASVEHGLGFVPEQSYFRGHLFEVRGLVEERQSKALAGRGDAAGAAAAAERALSAFQEAMRIQSEVIERSTPKSP